MSICFCPELTLPFSEFILQVKYDKHIHALLYNRFTVPLLRFRHLAVQPDHIVDQFLAERKQSVVFHE
jgi:hypothetical protein